MREFKFFQKEKIISPHINQLHNFNLDSCVLRMIRQSISNSERTVLSNTYPLEYFNIPINGQISINDISYGDDGIVLIRYDVRYYNDTYMPHHFNLAMEYNSFIQTMNVNATI